MGAPRRPSFLEGETKPCSSCGSWLSKEHFTRQATSRDGFYGKCKPCRAAYRRQLHQSNPEAVRVVTKRSHAKQRALLQAAVMEVLLESACVDCGEDDPVVLDFDHRDPTTKVAGVSFLLSKLTRWEKIKAEIDKCDVRCANCHRRKTTKDLGWFRGRQ